MKVSPNDDPETEGSARISAAAAEVKRIKEIGDAQRTFDLDKLDKFRVSLGNGDGKGGQNKKKVYFVQKHSEPSLLAEAIIVGGVPYFAVSRLDSGEVRITLKESIPITDKSEYKPLEESAYLNKPYRFESEDDFKLCVKKAKGETRDSIYRKVKAIWSRYIDADNFHISICAADTYFTYYQDIIGLTHYLFFVGPPGSGKSNNLLVFNYLGYRNFTSTDMTPANIYQFLGDREEGQGTICEDEADRIDEDKLKMAIEKNGYIKGFPVARTDTSFGRKQLKLNTFCFKAFAAESYPDPLRAKGFIQRCIEIQCSFGNPELDITEVTNPAGEKEFQSLLNELNEMRNTLLMFRLWHYHDKIHDIKLNIKGREKQLFKPIVRIFQKTETLAELLPVISNYVVQKREANCSSLHAFLYRVIKDLIRDRDTTRIESHFVWGYIKNNVQGVDVPGKPLSYDTLEFGIVSQKEITQTLEHIFGAKTRKSHGVKLIEFDLSKLKRLANVYDLPLEVNVVEGDDGGREDGKKGDDGDDGDDIGISRFIKSSVDEPKIITENVITERENTPVQQVVDCLNGPDRPHGPPNPTDAIPAELRSYEHVIETQYLPNLNQTAFRCKDHPDVYYYDPNGMLKSHFEPFHKTGTQDGL
jgi:hypothetical protein